MLNSIETTAKNVPRKTMMGSFARSVKGTMMKARDVDDERFEFWGIRKVGRKWLWFKLCAGGWFEFGGFINL